MREDIIDFLVGDKSTLLQCWSIGDPKLKRNVDCAETFLNGFFGAYLLVQYSF